MEIPPSLLEEHTRLLSELTHLENYLSSRYGWEKPSENSFSKPSPAPQVWARVATEGLRRQHGDIKAMVDKIDHGGDPAVGISYIKAASEWLSGVTTPTFTTNDFMDWMRAKYGESFNEASARGPFTKLAACGDIIIQTQGQGRRPTVYRKATH